MLFNVKGIIIIPSVVVVGSQGWRLEAYRRSSLCRHDGRRAHAQYAPHDLLMRMRRDVTSAGNRNTVCH